MYDIDKKSVIDMLSRDVRTYHITYGFLTVNFNFTNVHNPSAAPALTKYMQSMRNGKGWFSNILSWL